MTWQLIEDDSHLDPIVKRLDILGTANAQLHALNKCPLHSRATTAQAPKRLRTPLRLSDIAKMESAVRIFTPGEAAKELGVTTQSLRRYAEAYGDVFDEVPQHAGQRVFDDLFVTRLQTAQVLQHANKAPSIRAALEIVRDTSEAGDVLAEATQLPFEQVVLERLETLAQMVMRLQEENRMLHEGLRQLEAPKDAIRERELEVANADLKQRNQAMLQELERRSLQAEGKERPRPWWRFW